VSTGEGGPPVLREVQELIGRADAGNPIAAEQLFVTLYDELHRLAKHNLRKGDASLTLGATTLLHEAYLNIAGQDDLAFPDRARFLAYASRAMRRLVIDFGRRRQAKKRGREFEITLVGDEPATPDAIQTAQELERLGDALDELAALEPELTHLVDLHFFCGYTFAEIASLRDVSERTVQRDWRKARLLLQHALLPPGDH
jgi:RNA polymerase sigma factor (TIGR02999 family)